MEKGAGEGGWGKWKKGEDEERVKLRRRRGWEKGNVGRGKIGKGLTEGRGEGGDRKVEIGEKSVKKDGEGEGGHRSKLGSWGVGE